MRLFLSLAFSALPFTAFAQCTWEDYQALLREARAAQKVGQYDLAINKLSSAQTCRPEKAEEVKKRILEVFEEVNRQKELAVKNEQEAIRQGEIARQKATEAKIQRDSAIYHQNIATAEKEKAEKRAREIYAKSITEKSQAALKAKDRTLAFRLAEFACRYADPENAAVVQALIDALYYNDIASHEPSLPHVNTFFDGNLGHNFARLVDKVAFLPGDSLLAVNAYREEAFLWEIGTDRHYRGMEDSLRARQAFRRPDHAAIKKKWPLLDTTYQEEISRLSPDGQQLAAVYYDAIKIWNLKNGRLAETFSYKPGEHGISCVTFSPNGKFLAAGTDWGFALIWDINSGKLLQTLEGHSVGVRCLAFSPNGKYLATGSSDSTARVWEWASGQTVSLLAHNDQVIDLAFSSDGHRLATASFKANVWMPFGEQNALLSGPRPDSASVTSLAISPDGKYVAIGYSNGRLRVRDFPTKRIKYELLADSTAINGLCFSPEGERMAYISLSGAFGIRVANNGKNFGSGQTAIETDNVKDYGVGCVMFSKDGKRLLTGSFNGSYLTAWNLDGSGKAFVDTIFHDIFFGGQFLGTTGIAASPDGTQLATIQEELRNISIINANTGESVMEFETGWHPHFIAFFPYGKRLLIGEDDATSVFDLDKNRVEAVYHFHTGTDATLSPNGRWLALPVEIKESHQVYIRDMENGRVALTLVGNHSKITALDFSPDGKHLFAGCEDGSEYLWDLQGEQIIRHWQDSGGHFPLLDEEQLRQYNLEDLLELRPENEKVFLTARDTWQIAAFAGLYAQKVAETGSPQKSDYERALRLYQACLSHGVDDHYFLEKIDVLNAVWAKKNDKK